MAHGDHSRGPRTASWRLGGLLLLWWSSLKLVVALRPTSCLADFPDYRHEHTTMLMLSALVVWTSWNRRALLAHSLVALTASLFVVGLRASF